MGVENCEAIYSTPFISPSPSRCAAKIFDKGEVKKGNLSLANIEHLCYNVWKACSQASYLNSLPVFPVKLLFCAIKKQRK